MESVRLVTHSLGGPRFFDASPTGCKDGLSASEDNLEGPGYIHLPASQRDSSAQRNKRDKFGSSRLGYTVQGTPRMVGRARYIILL